MRTHVKLMSGLVVLVLLGLVSSASATVWGGGTGDWDIDGNWVGGVKPGVADAADILAAGSVVTLDTSEIIGSSLRVSQTASNVQLDVITGGSLTTPGLMTIANARGSSAVVNVSGTGSMNFGGPMWIGAKGNGTLNMSGSATVTGSGAIDLAWQSMATGHMQLDGGTVTAASLNWAPNGGTASMDITAGTLVIAGDVTAASWVLNDVVYSKVSGDGLGAKSAIYDGSAWTTITSIGGIGPPTDITWGGTPGSGGVAGNWSVGANWVGGTKADASSITTINYPGSHVTVNTTEEAATVNLGYNTFGLNRLDIITGGSVTISNLLVLASQSGTEGAITISGNGILNAGNEVWLGAKGLGTLTMSDTATFNITNDLIIAMSIASTADAVGDLQLHGGTLTVEGLLQWAPTGGTARLDIIPGATLVIAGDQTAASWIDLITYSISPGDGLGHKSAVYDGSTWTTITSTTPEPATIGLLALGAVGLLRRRRARKG